MLTSRGLKHGDSVLIEVEIEADYGINTPNKRYVASFNSGRGKDCIHLNEDDAFNIETHPLVISLRREIKGLQDRLK